MTDKPTKSRAPSIVSDVITGLIIAAVGAAIYWAGFYHGHREARDELLCLTARISGDTFSLEAARYCNRLGERVQTLTTPVKEH